MAIKIKTQTGNLLHVDSGHIVHGCNAQGVMGSGVALGVKNTWPEVYRNYKELYDEGKLHLGVSYPVWATDNLVIWNAITQDRFGGAGRFTSYDAIATCFEQINWHLKEGGVDNKPFTQVAEVYIPMIGAARGGGNWRVIEAIIEETMDFPVTLIVPDNTVTTL